MWNFDMHMLAYKYKSLYLCIVFFMVLDLRLSKDWVVVMTTFLFLSVSYFFFPLVINLTAKIRKGKCSTNEKYIFSNCM